MNMAIKRGALLAATLLSAPAWAARVHVGVMLGGPFWHPWGPPVVYAPPPYYPPVTVVETTPPVYVEKAPAEPAADGYWYYCSRPKGYYPYVKHCARRWSRVPATPPDDDADPQP